MRIFPSYVYILRIEGMHPTYKSCVSDLQKLCIRLTKVVHPIYKSCASDLQKFFIRPTKVVHLTYKSRASYTLMLCIRHTKVVHPTYKRSASNLQLSVQPNYSRSDTLTSFPLSVYVSDIQFNRPRAGRSCLKTTCG